MNGGSSFLLRVQARGLPTLSLPLQVGVVSFFCLVRVLSLPMTECVHFFPSGGEFSSLHQNSFHHYRDFWCFDIATHSWDRIDTKVRPSARSGHR